jgi:hypothetical protein
MLDAPLPEIKAPLPKVRKSRKSKKYAELRDREYLLGAEAIAGYSTAYINGLLIALTSTYINGSIRVLPTYGNGNEQRDTEYIGKVCI